MLLSVLFHDFDSMDVELVLVEFCTLVLLFVVFYAGLFEVVLQPAPQVLLLVF